MNLKHQAIVSGKINSFKRRLDRQLLLTISRRNAGFSMPISLGIGLTMMLVTATMMTSSQSDRQTTYSHREANRALSNAETGVIRVRAFLDRYKLLATKNSDRWVDTLNNLPSDRANCGLIDVNTAKQQANLYLQQNWINIDDLNLDKGRYKVINYQYQGGIGKLTVAGEVGFTGKDGHRTAVNNLSVEIPIGSHAIAPPGLWVNSLSLDANQQIKGDIRGVICPHINSRDGDGITGVDSTNISKVNNRSTGEIIADPFTSIPPLRTPPNNAIFLPAITKSIQLPRPDSIDTPDAKGEYHYLVDMDSPESGYSIELKDGDRIEITVPANNKVNLYLKGNIDFAGSQTINVSPEHPNLRIYGGSLTQKLSIKDNASITAFIHAPLANAQSFNSGSFGTGITGAVWVNSWDSQSHQSKLAIAQSGNWQDLGIKPEEQPPLLNPISYWQRTN